MARSSILALATFVALALVSACDNPVGRICDLGVENPSENQAILASPSLDCQSKLCLKIPVDATATPPPDFRPLSDTKGMCTDFCESDSDCDKVPESPCAGGFTCGIRITVGPFCCQKVCICKDYVVVPEGGIDIPAACDANNPNNACCNLPNRAGNAMYPNCPA